MPGNVQNAAPATVLPLSLSKSFVHERAYPLVENEYKNGESQRSVPAPTADAGGSWRSVSPPPLSRRCGTSSMRGKASTEPFYFYDAYDTSPRFSYDPTGATTVGTPSGSTETGSSPADRDGVTFRSN